MFASGNEHDALSIYRRRGHAAEDIPHCVTLTCHFKSPKTETEEPNRKERQNREVQFPYLALVSKKSRERPISTSGRVSILLLS